MGSTIFVLGGGGASGGVLAAQHIKAGHDVYIIDSNTSRVQQIKEDGGLRYQLTKAGEATLLKKLPADHVLAPSEFDFRPITLPQPDLVYSTVPNIPGNRDKALGLAKTIAQGAPIIELSNGLKREEDGVVCGVLNHPATVKGGVVISIKDADFLAKKGVAIGNDSLYGTTKPDALQTAKNLTEEAGIKVDDTQSTKQTIVNKLASVMAMGPQALLGTTFNNASNRQTLTSQITVGLLTELHAIAEEMVARGEIEKGFGDLDTFIDTQINIMKGKGESPGSLAMMINAGKKTEIRALYNEVAESGLEHNVNTPILRQTYALTEKLQEQSQRNPDGLESFRSQLQHLDSLDDYMALKPQDLAITRSVGSTVSQHLLH